MPDLTPEETARLAVMVDQLHLDGYVDIEEHKGLRVGAWIRHRNQQYYEAIVNGTGAVLALVEKPDSPWSREWRMPDIELVMLRDKEQFGSRLSQLAQYHVEVVQPTEES